MLKGGLDPLDIRNERRRTARLAVESQDVVSGQSEWADGCLRLQAPMGPMPVVAMEPPRRCVMDAANTTRTEEYRELKEIYTIELSEKLANSHDALRAITEIMQSVSESTEDLSLKAPH
ncbi:MAG: hypothetical protein FD149_1112 [Rhodospirillaceae bacterium]|nr:MAG: hypothetical protein FD149_1112 [Rhodospirillaceae bacterium]